MPIRINTSIGGIPLIILAAADPNADRSEADPRSDLIGDAEICFFMHGRQQTVDKYIDFVESLVVHAQNTRSNKQGRLIVVLFEQRNHGSRCVDPLANAAWTDGNRTHATDMWAIQFGTACDVSFLIETIPFAFPRLSVSKWAVAGVSLGGHASLLAVAHAYDRISAAVSIIGCGDYEYLIVPRAAAAGIATKSADPDLLLPKQLFDALAIHDPVHCIHHFGSQRILLLNGGSDNLVPASSNSRFVEKATIRYAESGNPFHFASLIEPEAKHKFTPWMQEKTKEWIMAWINDQPPRSLL